jgi:hypothetical protein
MYEPLTPRTRVGYSESSWMKNFFTLNKFVLGYNRSQRQTRQVYSTNIQPCQVVYQLSSAFATASCGEKAKKHDNKANEDDPHKEHVMGKYGQSRD